jgi:hypothetical protein
MRSLFAASLALAFATLSACGGSGDDFAYPGRDGATLEHTRMLTLANGTEVRNGGFGSAMARHPSLQGHFYALTDRGPNAATAAGVTPSGIIFVTPDYTPRLGLFKLDARGQVERVKTILLHDRAGRAISGLPNSSFGSTGETPYLLDGGVVGLDPDGDGLAGRDESGLDAEGLVALADGTFWVSDEYGPHLVHFDAEGREIARINPFAADTRNRPGRLLPAELARRWPNRGMEGLAVTPDGKTLVGIMQSNLYNPTRTAAGTTDITRIVTINVDSGAVAQYLYRQDAAGLANSEIVALSASRFLVIERDTKFFGRDSGTIRKNLYTIDLTGATNVDAGNTGLIAGSGGQLQRDAETGLLLNDKTLEQVIRDAAVGTDFAPGWAVLAARGIRPVAKSLVYDAVAAQQYPHDKMEGLWVIDATTVGIINDDDFAIEPDGQGGVRQKVLHTGKVDANTLYVVKLPQALY